MRLVAALLSLSLGIGVLNQLPAQASAAAPDNAAVRSVVEGYLRGLKFNDTTRFQAAFWPEALLLFVQRDGSLGRLTQSAWYQMFAGSAGKEEEGELRIESVDITGNAASVKVVEVYPKSIYTDYLNLLRIGKEWRIVNKIYTSRPR